jgi:hypothetical protein
VRDLADSPEVAKSTGRDVATVVDTFLDLAVQRAP